MRGSPRPPRPPPRRRAGLRRPRSRTCRQEVPPRRTQHRRARRPEPPRVATGHRNRRSGQGQCQCRRRERWARDAREGGPPSGNRTLPSMAPAFLRTSRSQSRLMATPRLLGRRRVFGAQESTNPQNLPLTVLGNPYRQRRQENDGRRRHCRPLRRAQCVKSRIQCKEDGLPRYTNAVTDADAFIPRDVVRPSTSTPVSRLSPAATGALSESSSMNDEAGLFHSRARQFIARRSDPCRARPGTRGEP